MNISLMPAYCFSCFFPFWSNRSDVFCSKCFCILFRQFLFLCLHKSLHYFFVQTLGGLGKSLSSYHQLKDSVAWFMILASG